MDSRQQFEEWHRLEKEAFVMSGDLGSAAFLEAIKETLLCSWKASRETLAVKLPDSYRSAGSKFELLNKQHMIDVLTENGIRTK